jgi:hypothetical protein
MDLTPQKLAAHWIEEINLAEADCQKWWTSGDVIIRRYRNDARGGRAGLQAVDYRRRYSILWSNVQTIGPAIYAKTPVPVVTRRFKDEDPVAKLASEVLERAIAYTLDCCGFDATMHNIRLDYLLPGRGQVWCRYVPTMRPIGSENDASDDGDAEIGEVEAADGEEPPMAEEEVAYEEVCLDHVDWKDFLTNPARTWDEVRWGSRRVFMTKEELTRRFGADIAQQIPLDWSPAGFVNDSSDDQGDRDRRFKRACIYEIWDKTSRRAIWISKGYTDAPLDVRDDPLKLKDFFPFPPPLNATVSQGSTLPVPDYVLYQDQAEELDDLTGRIAKLQDALRMVGFYAGENNVALQRVFNPGNENKLIPLDAYDMFKEKGGVKGMIEWVPVDMVIQTLTGCYEARQQVLNDIYQITGLSDIIRGSGDPNATATAERIKGQWGSLRVRDRQKDVQVFARNAIRIVGELIAEHFSIDTLRQMTGVKMLTAEEKAQVQQLAALAQQAQQAGLPPPPVPQEAVELLEEPTWDEVVGLLKDDKLRSFRIDIETDSTIEPDETAAKQAFVEYVGAISQLLTTAAGIVPAAPYTAPLFAEIAKESARVFSVSRTMEDTIDKVFETAAEQPPVQPAGPPPPSPLDEAKAQAEMAKVQVEQQRTQMEGMVAQSDAQLAAADLQLKNRDLDIKEAALYRDPNPQVSA